MLKGLLNRFPAWGTKAIMSPTGRYPSEKFRGITLNLGWRMGV